MFDCDEAALRAASSQSNMSFKIRDNSWTLFDRKLFLRYNYLKFEIIIGYWSMKVMSDIPQREPSLELFVVLSRAYNWVNTHATRDIRCHGLNPTEFGILEVLYHKGPLPLQQIGEKVLISSGNITYAVDKLEQKQLLVRRPSPQDRRVIFAELTSQGQEMLAAIFPQHAEALRQAVSGLSPEEQNQAIQLLKKLGQAAQESFYRQP
jgi:MarR family transcriptional regulator, 2-MHQ and catechol-resistance regulon repressor